MPHQIEERFPLQTDGFKSLVKAMYQLHLDKQMDYSPANIVIAGDIGIIVRIWDKFCRICNLSGLTFPTVKPKIISAKENVLSYFKKDSSEYAQIEAIFDDLIKNSEFDWSNIKEKPAINEPLDDAWQDLATYSIIGILSRKGLWGR
jgi:hypothetical protein